MLFYLYYLPTLYLWYILQKFMGCAFETILSMIICLLKVVPSLNIDQDKKKKKKKSQIFSFYKVMH